MSDWKEQTIQTYNRVAQAYHDSIRELCFWEKEIETLERFLGRTGRIIDIGCGTGRDSALFQEKGFEYVGIDASEGMIAVAKQQYPDAVFRQMDFSHLDFPDQTFDAFWAAASFLHVPKSELPKILREARRVTNGVGFLCVKKGEGERMVEDKRRGGMHRYFAFYQPAELKEILEREGFTVLKIEERLESHESRTDWLCYFVRT